MPIPSSILVTGCPRSGTTWVGSTLAASPKAVYIYEPFNTDAPRNLGIRQRFLHLTARNADHYHHLIRPLIGLADLRQRVLRCARGAFDVRSSGPALPDFIAWRSLLRSPGKFLRADRVCLKDPLAFFAAEWLAETFGTKVVVVLRHPAGVISSYLRLGWGAEVDGMLAQPSLRSRFLGPLMQAVEDYERRQADPLQAHILQWNIFAHAALQLKEAHPDWLFVRHEELCRRPQEQFQAICAYAGIPWTGSLERKIELDSTERNEVDPMPPRQHALRRASGELPDIWRKRLEADTIDRITGETAEAWNAILSM